MNYGYIQSQLDGTEQAFISNESLPIPSKYSYINYLPPVINQGNQPICVPCSISAYINQQLNLSTGSEEDNNIDLMEIFNYKHYEDGMSIKDALQFLKECGVQTDKGLFKISDYATVGSETILKQALLINGICIGALPVYDSSIDKFWRGYELEGGHAIAIVGYDENGFIIRNSWGKHYGEDGYNVINYKDFPKFFEIWTII